MKFALLSSVLPPFPSGQSVVIKRLLDHAPPEWYCTIGRQRLDPEANGAAGRLRGRHYFLPAEWPLRGHRLGLQRFRNHATYLLAAFVYARGIARILRHEKCEAVIACTDYLLDMPAGYNAARAIGVPFYAYIFDDYGRKWIPREELAFARRVEPHIYKGAAGIIVPNEFMSQTLRERYGVTPTVIHNPCDLSDYQAADEEGSELRDGDGFRIVYTGAVYDAHYDAFRNLLAALAALPQADAKLHVYTPFAPDQLIAQGLSGPVVYHEQNAQQMMPEVQRGADVLFLPLAFDSPYPEVIRTSAPGKLGEYLAARRPVLVHAPADSFVAWYFHRHDCGLVVSEQNPRALAAVIERLRADADLRRRLSQNAWARAQADFSVTAARARFARLLGLESGQEHK